MKILITGFEPFGGESTNPAYEAVKILPNEINGIEIAKLEIPVVFKKSVDIIEKEIEEISPDVVLCIGQAGGRFDISVERVAINIDVARIPDNEGNSPLNTKIEEDGKNAYFANLPINAMVQKSIDNNIPASVSNTAGTYVCNHVMYGLLHLIDTKYPNIKGGFVHVPFSPDQVMNKRNVPYMTIEMIAKGLECFVQAIHENENDISSSFGETH